MAAASAGLGESVDYTITYLAMETRPAPPPPAPIGVALALIRSETPTEHYFLYLYGQVGAPYHWTDWFEAEQEVRQAFLQAPEVSLFTLMVDGCPGGFFMLDAREAGMVDLAYFGLMQEVVGRGLGRWFLGSAVQTAWDLPGVHRLTVNTCTLDHPRALPLYQQAGFVPERREVVRRKLTRPPQD